MTQQIIYPNGTATVSVPIGEYIKIGAYEGKADIFLGVAATNAPATYSFSQEIENEEVTLGTYSVVKSIQITAGAGKVFYDVGSAPSISFTEPMLYQGAAAAKTVSATLTAEEILGGEITVNQGGGAASALQLPLATALDTALPASTAGAAFDFSLTNISTTAAEDASITTNTGWTLVGNMDVASNAAATDKSAGLFRAKKTGAGAWTLTRRS